MRAIDNAGNTGSWMAGPTFRLTHYGETSSRLAYSGTWATSTSSVYWGGKAKASSQPGARATLTFTGRSVEVVSRKGPARGKAQIYINGVLKATIDLYAASYQNQRVVWAANCRVRRPGASRSGCSAPPVDRALTSTPSWSGREGQGHARSAATTGWRNIVLTLPLSRSMPVHTGGARSRQLEICNVPIGQCRQ